MQFQMALPINLAGLSDALVSNTDSRHNQSSCVKPVNNVHHGTGTGRNQKLAKEEAAKQALRSLGWGSE